MKSIRGMSIANIVMGAFWVLVMLVIVIAFAVAGPIAVQAINDGSLNTNGVLTIDVSDGHGHSGTLGEYLDMDDITPAATSAATLSIGFAIGIFAFFLAMYVVCFVGAILAYKNAGDRTKYGSVLGWSIAGAICSAIAFFNVPMVVLYIIVAAFAGKDKKLYEQGFVTDVNGYFCTPDGYAYVDAPPAPPVQPGYVPVAQPYVPNAAQPGQIVGQDQVQQNPGSYPGQPQ